MLTLPGPIVSAAWLLEHATHPDLRIVALDRSRPASSAISFEETGFEVLMK